MYKQIYINIILICLFVILPIKLKSFNRVVPLYNDVNSIARSSFNFFESEGNSSGTFNPALVISDVKIIELSYINSSYDKYISGISFLYSKKDYDVSASVNNLRYKIFNNLYDTTVYSLIYSFNIEEIVLGIGFDYNSVNIDSTTIKGKSYTIRIGIKQETELDKGHIIVVGLSYQTSTKVNYDYKYEIIPTIPSQMLLNLNFNSKNFDVSGGLHYVFPVSLNEDSNYSIIETAFPEEYRVTLNLGVPFWVWKIVVGYQGIFDKSSENISRNFIGFGVESQFNKFNIKVGYNSNNFLENSEEIIRAFGIGINFTF